jgi:hypothetical protein
MAPRGGGSIIAYVHRDAIVGAAHRLSLTFWARTPQTEAVDITVVLEEYATGFSGVAQSHTVPVSILPSTDFQRYIVSYDTTHATGQDYKVYFSLAGANPIKIWDICAVHLCDITDINSAYLYTDPVTGYSTPSTLLHNNESLPINNIVSEVGPWLCDRTWVYNYQYNSWTCWEIPATAFSFDALSTTKTIADLIGTIEEQTWRYDDKLLDSLQETTLLGMVDGQLYEVSPLYSRDWEGSLNQLISSFWESKDFDMGAPYMEKTYLKLALFHEVSHPAIIITIGISTDSGVSWYEQDITIRTGYTETFCDFISTGRQARFRLRATTPGFNLTGLSIKVAPRGEAYAL